MSFILRFLTIVVLLFIFSCEEEVDTIPPTVSIQSPISNQSISEIVTIVAETDDNEGISKVEFFINDSLFFTDTESPYEYEWNTTQYEDNSEHIVKVISYDNSENSTTSQPIVYVVDNFSLRPNPVYISHVNYINGAFSITWSMSTDDNFSNYKLLQITSDGNKTLIEQINEEADTNFVITNLYNNEQHYIVVEIEGYLGLASASNTIITYHRDCEPFLDRNGNGVYDHDVREGIFSINGQSIILDFGLDGIPALDINEDGDYDDEGDIAPDVGEGNGIWDGETFENLNNSTEIIDGELVETWDCY